MKDEQTPGTPSTAGTLKQMTAQQQDPNDVIAALQKQIQEMQVSHMQALEDQTEFFAQKNPDFRPIHKHNKKLNQELKRQQGEFKDLVKTFRSSVADVKIMTPNAYIHELIQILGENSVPDLTPKQYEDYRETSTGVYMKVFGAKGAGQIKLRLVGHPTDIAAAALSIGMITTQHVMGDSISKDKLATEIQIEKAKVEADKITVEGLEKRPMAIISEEGKLVKEERFEEGDFVSYYSEHPGVPKYQRGIVKSIAVDDEKHVFVVFACNGEWNRYMDFTAEKTHVDQLVRGWYNEAGEKVEIDAYELNPKL